MALTVVDQDLDRVEAHRLGVDQPDQELRGVEELEERGFVGRPGEGRRVALGEAEAREGGDLPEELLGHGLGHARLAEASLDELRVELLHLAGRAPRPHRPAEAVRVGRAEAGDLDGDPHDLLLVEDHAERVVQHRLQAGVEIGHGLQSLLAAQVRMNCVALDRAGPDDRDLHHQVVEARRPRLGQRLHLGPALDLEDAHGVGRLEHLEDFRDLLGQPVEVEADRAVVLDQLHRFVHRGQHPEAEQVELDELEGLHVALVELDDDAAGHGRPLQRRDVDERCSGHEHAPRVDAQVTGKSVEPGAHLEPAVPVRESDGRAEASLGLNLGLDPRDRGMAFVSGPVRGPVVGAPEAIRVGRIDPTIGRRDGPAFGIDPTAIHEAGQVSPIPRNVAQRIAGAATASQPAHARGRVTRTAFVVAVTTRTDRGDGCQALREARFLPLSRGGTTNREKLASPRPLCPVPRSRRHGFRLACG